MKYKNERKQNRARNLTFCKDLREKKEKGERKGRWNSLNCIRIVF
jgi:hypothetical protein